MTKRRGSPCPIECNCLCHDTGGVHGGMHGDHPRCPTKDGLPLIDPWPEDDNADPS